MIDRILRSAAGPYLLLTATSLGTLFFRLGALPFIGADEPRYARIAEEMGRSGNWVTPVLQGYPWLEKPPLYYWITIPWYRLLGVSETAARLGPALCALLAGAALVWLGTRLWSRTAGLLAGLILVTSIGFSAFGRSASPDMPLTASFTIAMSLLAAAALRHGIGRWKILAAYVLLGLAVLAKGPVALVLFAGIVALFWALDDKGDSLRRMHVVTGAILATAVALPWFWLAFRENGFSFISIFIINHNVARYVSDIHHHEQPLYYFLPVLLGLFFPWTGWISSLVPSAPRRKILDPRLWDRSILFVACWALFPFLFFSISNSKLPGYILPSLPPLALLLGRALDVWSAGGQESRAARIAPWSFLGLSFLVAAAIPIVMNRRFGMGWTGGILLTLVVALPAGTAFWFARRGRRRAALQTSVVQGLLFVLAFTQVGFGPLGSYQSTREIARSAIAADADGSPIITYLYFHHTLNYYSGYRIVENLQDPRSLEEYARRNPRFLLITEEARVQDLDHLPGFSVTPLAEQAKLRLLRVEFRLPPSETPPR